MNKENKKIWDDIFAKQPPVTNSENDEEGVTMCENEDGEWVPATPIGYDDGQKTFDALKEIIESAIKKKSYKTWRIGTKLVETYDDKHESIEEFDVIYLFTNSWEEPVKPVLVKEITEDYVTLQYLGGADNESILKTELPYEK